MERLKNITLESDEPAWPVLVNVNIWNFIFVINGTKKYFHNFISAN